MARLRSQIDTKAQTYIANRAGLSTLLRHHDAQVAMALAGGGESTTPATGHAAKFSLASGSSC